MNSTDSVFSPAALCNFEKTVPEPRADLGILLVHGIGDHQEGETLAAFGEPLLDWMRQWVRGHGTGSQRGVLTVPEARLKADGAPAYALAELNLPSGTDLPKNTSHAAPPAQERWLVCEGWWGGSVQAPPSWDLLVWMWSHGPLLIYWHFYLVGIARGYRSRSDLRPVRLIIPAFLIASFCQLAVGIAMLLWLIPIGPWRKGVVAVVRVLTLTLGDSYVLLEQEIQHAALVERVRRSLAWLAEQTAKIVVVAHSQGGTIAHEALRRDPPPNVASFISVGSGLEKLHFLRTVVGRRAGLVASGLVFPACLLTLGMAIVTWGSGAQLWQEALTWVCAAGVFGVVIAVFIALDQYREEAEAESDALKPPAALQKMQWLDLYATHDVVPMGYGSLLRDATFLTRAAVCNERSVLHDHVTYFTNYNDCLHRIWMAIAQSSGLPLFRAGDLARLNRFAGIHGRYARLVALSRITCIVAAFIIGFLLREQLVGFGESVLTSVSDTPADDWLKPVRAVAAGFAWLVDRWWRPSVTTATMLTQAFLGGALLLGGILLWWAGFRAFWHWRCTARWRAAARGEDIEEMRGWSAARSVGLCVFALAGSLPLLVSILIYFWPGLLTFDALGRLLAGLFSLLLLSLVFLYAVGGPWMDAKMRQDGATTRGTRLVTSVSAAFLAIILLLGAGALWPATLDAVVRETLVIVVTALIALSWQFYALWVYRQTLGSWMTWLVALLPLAGAVVFCGGRGQLGVMIYAGVTAALIGGAFLWHRRRELPQIAKEAWRFLSSQE